MAPPTDPFERFATERGIRISTAELGAAPRDIRASPAELDRHVLVELTNPRADAPPLRTLFLTAPEESNSPTMRDVLWWLASDAWAVDRAHYDLGKWAAMYEYPDGEPATLRLFRLHVGQAEALRALVGDVGYRDLLTLHQRDAPPRR
jgi:hypothetical protein